MTLRGDRFTRCFARRRNGLKGFAGTPPPFVLQSSLSDFYVEYTLNFQPEEPAQRVFILSELHTNIQDAFNEHGVQILSPHFMSQPEHSVVVPRERWWSAPADRTSLRVRATESCFGCSPGQTRRERLGVPCSPARWPRLPQYAWR